MLEEIEFHRLAKLKLDVDEAENMSVSYLAFSCRSLNVGLKRYVRTGICL